MDPPMLEGASLGFLLKKLLAGLLLFPGGPAALIVVGLWWSGRRRRLGVLVASVGVAIIVGLSMPIVANGIARPQERAFPPLSVDLPIPPDAVIVVLGGGMQQGALDYGGETVNATTLARLRSAARLAARTRLPILVSGGRPEGSRISEAEQMAEALQRDFGTHVRWIEKGSLDTADNARLSAALLKDAGFRTALLVTDVSHMGRARSLFEAAGLPVIAAPTDYYADAPVTVFSFLPNTGAFRRSAWTVHEWLGRLWNALPSSRSTTS